MIRTLVLCPVLSNPQMPKVLFKVILVENVVVGIQSVQEKGLPKTSGSQPNESVCTTHFFDFSNVMSVVNPKYTFSLPQRSKKACISRFEFHWLAIFSKKKMNFEESK